VPPDGVGVVPASGSAVGSEAAATATRTAGGATEFVAVVRARLPDVAADRLDDEIASVATTACAGLRKGTAAQTVVDVAKSLDTLDAEATDEATARELVTLAIDTVCPDQATRVDEFRPA
jgi:hypothetical protein